MGKSTINGELSIAMYDYQKVIYAYIFIFTGWWFGTFFCFHNIWDEPSH
jgi:hypothetical protein